MTIPLTTLAIRRARRSVFGGAKVRMTRWAAWAWRLSRRTKLKCLNCSRPTANTYGRRSRAGKVCRPFEAEQIQAPRNNSNRDGNDLQISYCGFHMYEDY